MNSGLKAPPDVLRHLLRRSARQLVALALDETLKRIAFDQEIGVPRRHIGLAGRRRGNRHRRHRYLVSSHACDRGDRLRPFHRQRCPLQTVLAQGFEFHGGNPPPRHFAHQLANTLEVLLAHPFLDETVRCDQLQPDRGFLRTQRPDPGVELLRGHFITQKAAAALPGHIHPVKTPKASAETAGRRMYLLSYHRRASRAQNH